MTACLRCDWCSKAVAEHEGDLRQWWRLARHGVEWADEAAAPKIMGAMLMQPQVSMRSTFIGDFPTDDGDDDDVIVGVIMDDEIDEDEPSATILHFCSAACLGEWATQAAALE